MKINIVCPDGSWILAKMARNLTSHLRKLDLSVTLSKKNSSSVDINHTLCYVDYKPYPATLNTALITHVDAPPAGELELIRSQIKSLSMGICMSRQTMRFLVDSGIPENKLNYVNPAHDACIPHRRIGIGIFTRLYSDGRKRENMLLQLADHISESDFKFYIIGAGWSSIVNELRSKKFIVNYSSKFKTSYYHSCLEKIDYYLYLGLDEGSIGFVDALASGIPCIVTPQGFHLDALSSLQFSFTTFSELLSIFISLSSHKRERQNAVSSWTWEGYALKHKLLWESLFS